MQLTPLYTQLHMKVKRMYWFIWASMRQNPSSGFPTKRDSNQLPVSSATEASKKIEISLVASSDMILLKKVPKSK